MRIALIHSRVRQEEKLLLEAFGARGIAPEIINDGDLVLNPLQPDPFWLGFDLVFQRSLSTNRALQTLQVLEAWGVPTINTYQTSATCADKLQTSLALAGAGLEQPALRLAFTQPSALEAIEALGYPVVIKPIAGSWGRMVARLNDRAAAEAVLEDRFTLGSYPHHSCYLQQYIEKEGGRDIRAFVIDGQTIAAIYRTSPHWITNTARGGQASSCPITPQLSDVCRQAAAAVGGGMLAIDLFEAGDRLLVNEVNHTMEFRNSIAPTGVDIPALMVDYCLTRAANPQAVRR